MTAKALAEGLTVSMLTLTQRHHRGQRLEDLWEALSYAWNRTASGVRWQGLKEQRGVIGTVRTVEVTHGKNGWHVHTHILMVSEKDPSSTVIFHQRKQGRRRTPYPVEMFTPKQYLAQRWEKALAARGVDFLADRGGIDWEVARDGHAVGRYVAKLGGAAEGETQGQRIANEATLGAFKRARRDNRTPFQILADFAETGDADDLKLWHIWEKVSQGRRALLWSRNLRKWANIGVEKTDEEIAEEEAGDEVLALFDADGWNALREAGAATLLDVIEAYGPRSAYRWLDRKGVPYVLADSPPE